MSRFERDVREMLERRASDIEGHTASRSAPARASRWRVAVAATIAVVAGGGAFALWQDEIEPADVTTEAERPVTLPTDEQTPTTVVEEEGDQPLPHMPADRPAPPTDWRALLPADFSPETAASLYNWPIRPEDHAAPAGEAVYAYLENRLGTVIGLTSVEIEVLHDSPTITANHVLFTVDDRWAEHLVVTRRSEFGIDIVAAVSLAIDVTDVRRTVDGISGTVANSSLDLLTADVLTPGGDPVDGSPNPQGVTGVEPVFGTAGAADGVLPGATPTVLELDVPLGADELAPAILRLRHVGGTWLSITELALRAPSIVGLCDAGDARPHAIGLGAMFEGRAAGPIAESAWPTPDGQQREHAVGEFGSIEIMWPPSPEWLDHISRQQGDEPQSIWRSDGFGSEDLVIGTGNDPCDWTQIVLDGDPAVMGWFADAITGMWGVLGVDPDLGTLDPADLEWVLGEAEPVDPAHAELVVGTIETSSGPASIPQQGSCDGLPDAPPQSGVPEGITGPTSEAALEAFLDTDPGDPPLPSVGYVRVLQDGKSVAFVIEGPSFPIVSILVAESTDGTWSVDAWEAAAC